LPGPTRPLPFVLLFMSGMPEAAMVEAALPDEASRAEFRALARQYGAAP